MKLELYNTNDSKDTINKTLTLIDTLDINLKSSTNIISPVLIITRKAGIDYEKINYGKMDNRNYYIEYYELPNQPFIKLYLEEDVLETYKNLILNSQATIIKTSKPTYSTVNIPTDSRHEKLKYNSDIDFKNQSSTILVTIGA